MSILEGYESGIDILCSKYAGISSYLPEITTYDPFDDATLIKSLKLYLHEF